MTMTNPISSSAGSSGSGSAATSSVQGTESQFLQLLVTQMQNQDPLNPMDNAQVTSQIAQLDTVQGIDTMNSTLTSLAANFAAAQSLQATSLIGQNVVVPGSSINLQNGSATFGVNLPQSVSALNVSIEDSAGNLLHSMNVGPQAAGTVMLNWNGVTDSGHTEANGSYQIVVSASSGGNPVTTTPLTLAQVQSVSTGSSGAVLNLVGGQTAALSTVQQFN